jgi:serine/threonine protein kinase
MPVGPVKIPGYELLRQLGSGGMSTVWLATQESLQRKVAIKVMRRAHESSGDDVRQFEKRFLLEGRTMAKLPHRNIVAVYDIVSNEDVSYIAMEYLEDGTLSERMQAGLSLAEAVSVVVQIGAALDFAHQHNIVHRDLKPANIMFRDPATPVLTDFGIARQQDQAATRLTQTGMLVGTPNYMSPEQISGGDVDGRSDLYSLGIMFFELLSGKTPFNGDTPIAVMMAHLTTAPPPLAPEFAFFQPVVDRMLAKNRDDRYADLREFIAALKQRVVGSETLLTRLKLDPALSSSDQLRQLGFTASDPAARSNLRSGPIKASQPLPRPQQASRQASAAAPVERPRWPWFALGGAALAGLLGIGVWLAVGRGGLSGEERELVGFWLKDATRHVEARRLVSPPGDNAYELLQKLLQKDPDNADAQALLDRIATAMREEAQAALDKGDYATALDRAEQGLFVRKDDAALAALKTRIDTERTAAEQRRQIDAQLAGAEAAEKAGRPFGPDGAWAQLQRAAQIAPADAAIKTRIARFVEAQLKPARDALATDPARAAQLLASLKADLGGETAYATLVSAAQNAQQTAERERQIAGLVARGAQELAAGRYDEPVNANAFATLGQLREVAPDEPRVRAFAGELAAALVADGRKAAAASPQRALERAELALRVEPGRADAGALKTEIETRLGQRLADIGRALSAAKQALAEERFLAPPDANARAALAEVSRLDPDNAEARMLAAELPRRIAAAIDARTKSGDTAGSLALAQAAAQAYPTDAALKDLLARVDAQSQREQADAAAAAARERTAVAIAMTPATPESLANAATLLTGVLATDPRNADALGLRKRLAEIYAAAQRSAVALPAFDAFTAFGEKQQTLLGAEPEFAAVRREAAALRGKLVEAEAARVAATQGELVLNAQPWAKVESVLDGNRKPVTLPADASTPFALKLPAGSYVITFRHPQAAKPVTVIAKVDAQRRASANAAFPTISAEDYFTRAGW